ncbi:GNAT family N-acetyltransferase [Arthrobacter sp. KBS0703]|uniref:GNAT family N-acetyltransferase n=1 Tax=Arthrobacter sp. KBS0703 TaxID=1955698 RepID=UPI0028C438C5|nr:GNAT family N-acetyltransferase [Arthrobacter sp. KBS0703]
MSVLENVEHRGEHAEVWVAEASGTVVAAVTLTFAGQPYSEVAVENELEFRMLAVDPAVQGGGVGRAVVRRVIEHAESFPNIRAISITSATFMERAHALYESLGFRRVPARDWYVPGEDVLLGVFRLELAVVDLVESARLGRWLIRRTPKSRGIARNNGGAKALGAHQEASQRQHTLGLMRRGRSAAGVYPANSKSTVISESTLSMSPE